MGDYTYDEAIQAIIRIFDTPITKRKYPELYKCIQVIKAHYYENKTD